MRFDETAQLITHYFANILYFHYATFFNVEISLLNVIIITHVLISRLIMLHVDYFSKIFKDTTPLLT